MMLLPICTGSKVIGGEKDEALGPEASRELAEHIPNAALKMYPQ